ncbi:MAG: FtsQ-type POTRA domain-containing protein [Clostridiales bacterium]|nr:FtsQ-type POTRA domain-containing protein [Clostridiales bacterium]
MKEIYCNDGNSVSSEFILNELHFKVGKSIFLINSWLSKKRIFKNPYIKIVKIKKVFPNKIFVNINERKKFIKILNSNGNFFIDDEGFVLEFLHNEKERCELQESFDVDKCWLTSVLGLELEPVIGKKISPKNVECVEFLTCVKALERKNVLNKIVYIDLSDLKDIKLNYMNKIFVTIGDTSNIPYKIRFMCQILEDYISGESGELAFLNNDFYFKIIYE